MRNCAREMAAIEGAHLLVSAGMGGMIPITHLFYLPINEKLPEISFRVSGGESFLDTANSVLVICLALQSSLQSQALCSARRHAR